MSKYLNYFNKLYEEQEKQKKKQELRLVKSQLELLKLLASGLTIQEIATKLNKKYENIKKRTQNLYFKLGAVDRYWLIKLSILFYDFSYTIHNVNY